MTDQTEYITDAIELHPFAVVVHRKFAGHTADCTCTQCTPVLKEMLWFGEEITTDPVPEDGLCRTCGKQLTLAARGNFEMIGQYRIVNRWYHRCCAPQQNSQ